MPSSKRSPSKKSGSKSKKSLTKYIAPKKKAAKKSKRVSKKHRSSSSRGGISQDAMVLMALTQHQNKGQPLDAIIPWLLLTDNNSLKTDLIPLVVYHLQSNGGAGNCMLAPYLLAFQNGTLNKNDLLLYMTQMKDQYGQPMLGNGMGLGGGFGGNNNNLALAMIAGGGRLDARSLLLVQYLQGNHGFTNQQDHN